MKLGFVCPETQKVFFHGQWSVEESLYVVDHGVERRLGGQIGVSCPICGGLHRYTPQEVLCPLGDYPQQQEARDAEAR